jgi:hypothetical protein
MIMFNKINNLQEQKTVKCRKSLIQITLCKINLSVYPTCFLISTFVFWQNVTKLYKSYIIWVHTNNHHTHLATLVSKFC